MKWILTTAWLLGSAFLTAQNPTERKSITLEDIQRMLNDENSELSKLKRQIIGEGDTNRFFYFPTRDQPATPENSGFAYEDVNFNSADGTKLHGWFLKPKTDKPKGTVVFSHGNAGSLGHHLGFVTWLAEA